MLQNARRNSRMICLYHGTNVVFDLIDPLKGRRGTDFGRGFYLTPNSRMSKQAFTVKAQFISMTCFAKSVA